MKTYEVGVVGYGWAAGAHIAAINATGRGRVSAVCSSRPLDEAELSKRHGAKIRVYRRLEAMLADRTLHVVSICSYPADHARQAMAAARAGKHLILEKPLCLRPADLPALQRAVAKAKVRTCVCFELRYSSQFIATRSILDQGLLGKLHYGEVDYYHGIGPWYGQYRWNVRKDAGGSSLLSAGCHALDMLLHCMGTDVESVTSAATGSAHSAFRNYEYPTTSVTVLRFRNGSVGKVTSSIDCLQPYYFHVHLVGSEGSLLDNKLCSARIQGLGREKWSQLAMKLCDSGDVSDHPYQSQFEAFFAALDAGQEMPFTSLREAARTHAVLFAADRSAATGRSVRVPRTA
jgi:predicted dehydrogenase